MVLKRLVAFTEIDTARLPPMRMSRENDAFRTWPPGPTMMFRGAVPNAPTAGTEKAAVLKKSPSVGSFSEIGTPGFRLARSEPTVPVATLLVAPTTRAVNGDPEWAEKLRF